MEISPEVSAQLAKEVYAVQREFDLKVFLLNPIFSRSDNNAKSFKATVGGQLINTQDGFCVAARGGAGFEKDLFLMFRGSTFANFGADWLSNARCGVEPSAGGLVHVGFSHIFNSMREEIGWFISQQLADRLHPIQTIHCIGHSLGGAVATLAANWVKRTTHKDVVLYTFGAPKPGFQNFAKSATTLLKPGNVHRVYHATDPVPMVPLYPFCHPPLPGYGHFMGSTNSILSAGAHDMGEYIKSVKGLGWDTMTSPPPAFGYDRVVEKWLESEGSLNPFKAETWGWINAGLEYVLKKILGDAAIQLQAAFIGGLSLADKIAWLLAKGIDLTRDSIKSGIDKVGDTGKWVLRLMRKMMQALQMKVVKTVEELTRALMRVVLERIADKISREAMKALHRLTGNR